MEVKNKEDLIRAKAEIALLRHRIKEFEDAQTNRTLKMKVSITGILWRVYEEKSGFNRLRDLRHHYSFLLENFSQDFEATKKAWEEGDIQTVSEFFESYN